MKFFAMVYLAVILILSVGIALEATGKIPSFFRVA